MFAAIRDEEGCGDGGGGVEYYSGGCFWLDPKVIKKIKVELGLLLRLLSRLRLASLKYKILFCWVLPNLFCYFWLDPKVTKKSRPNLVRYSVLFVRCRV